MEDRTMIQIEWSEVLELLRNGVTPARNSDALKVMAMPLASFNFSVPCILRSHESVLTAWTECRGRYAVALVLDDEEVVTGIATTDMLQELAIMFGRYAGCVPINNKVNRRFTSISKEITVGEVIEILLQGNDDFLLVRGERGEPCTVLSIGSVVLMLTHLLPTRFFQLTERAIVPLEGEELSCEVMQ